MAAGFRETVFMRCIWRYIFSDPDVGCTMAKEDNQGAIHLAGNPVTTPNSKRVNARHHFLQERFSNGEFEVIHVSSALKHADFLIKPLHPEAFRFHRNCVMSLW